MTVWCYECCRLLLAAQLSDARTAVVKDACAVVCAAAQACGDRFGRCAEYFTPSLQKLLSASAAVLRDSADAALRTIIRVVRSGRLLCGVVLRQGLLAEPRHPQLRERLQTYLAIALQLWPTPTLDDQQLLDLVEDALFLGVQDAAAEARAQARKGFGALQLRWPERAAQVQGRLSVRDLKTLQHQQQQQQQQEQQQHQQQEEEEEVAVGILLSVSVLSVALLYCCVLP